GAMRRPVPTTRRDTQNARPAAQPLPTSSPAARPPAPLEQPPAPSLAGKWTAPVKYSWGVSLDEKFDFKIDEGEVIGTASYLGTPRGILEGKVEGTKITFLTKTQTMLGSQTYEEKHRYRGRISGDTIEFILQTDSGYDTRPPETFTAKRAAP